VSQSIIPDSTFINSKIRVAAILPISGANKEIGTAVFNSIVLSLFENDKNDDIELVVFDSKNNAQDAKKAINSIVSQNIKIIIGPIFSNNVEAISDIVSKNNITALSISNNQDLANKKGIFLMGFLPEQQIEGLTSYAISNGNNNISIIVPDNQYGLKFSSIAKEMIRRKDGNLISNKFYLDSSKDLEKIVAETINSYLILPQSANKNSTNLQPQDKIYSNTILIPESGIALSKINNLIKKFNTSERPIQIIGSSNWDDISTLNDPNLIGGWFVSASPTKYRDFEKRYYNTYNKFPPRISSIGYDAILALLKVIESSNTKDISPADFINYQSSKNGFNGIDGLFRFLPNGLVQRNFAILQIGNGKFEILESPNTMFFKY
jgi:ABC-type branched-subunit amino acid transport system substrate-binding protein